MKVRKFVAAGVGLLTVFAGYVIVGAQTQLPLSPAKERGNSITGSFEGWYKNDDGTFTLLMGSYNRNTKETIEIPVGPNNRIEPGGPDLGQPTTFEPRRSWGVFSIVVPKDFGTKKYSWTITANGETTTIPLSLHSQWEISPFKDAAMGNTPPTLKFSAAGPALTGPPKGIAATYSGAVNQPVAFDVWVADKGNTEVAGAPPPGFGRGSATPSVSLHKFRGPGAIKWARERPEVSKEDGKVSASGTFSAPGEYIVRVQVNDSSGEGGGGFQCCWTNAHVKVTIK